MNKKNIVHDVVNAVMLNSTDFVSVKASLREGRVIGVLVYTDGTENINNNLISVGFKSGNKGYEEEPVHVHNYKHPDNGYEGLRPVNFIAGRTVFVEFTALKKLGNDSAFQVVFVIDTTEENY
ncbi:hypothetical protein [Bizionia myxarmorum]|uniref:Uncharacterized protein n=1 Tax=Bizionia myxarmorum TaxID=291186 RepID=A0A5D0R9K6_9FLAO|nr:hypothetical protein [Bizionia myxarmorum]TYB78330.1 hypothetical protein ES674_00690 [Bizionia myxarmorum]